MKFLVLIAVLVSFANGFPLPSSSKVVGGTPANITEAPYQVAVLVENSNSGQFELFCGGSIISRRVILTAAHCTNGTHASQMKIRAGSSFHNKGGQNKQVSSIVQHLSFNDRFDNDISLLFLNSQLTLGPEVATVTLPFQGQTVPDGSTSFITGWGATDYGSPEQLQKANVPVVNQKTCASAYFFINPVTDRMICAGMAEVGVCNGDSGGPMVVDGVLHGVTSWNGGDCGSAKLPGVFTRVAQFRNWIESNM